MPLIDAVDITSFHIGLYTLNLGLRSRPGVTLNEIKQLVELTREGQRPCHGVRELARRHLNSHSTAPIRRVCHVHLPDA